MKDDFELMHGIKPTIIDTPAITRITEPPSYDPLLAYLEFELKQREENVKFWSKVVKIIGVGGLALFIVLGVQLLT